MFNRALGKSYIRFLDELHARNLFDWYMEIGCRSGRTFGPVRGKTIAVDPYYRVETNVIGAKPALHILQQTSDDFFASGFLKAMKIKLSFSFLDGMHLFEYLLRDFIGTEAHSRETGVIALHDCYPYHQEMTTRDLANLPKGAWAGDVWKLLPILRTSRPDLKITVLDCKPTGLVLISNLKPGDQTLKKNYDKIIEEYRDLTLQDFGPEKFAADFPLVDARTYAASGYPDFAAIRLPDDAFVEPEKTRA